MRTDIGPGLQFKIPIIESPRIFDRRLQVIAAEPERYLTSERKDVSVDFFALGMIENSQAFFRATGGDEELAVQRLAPIMEVAIARFEELGLSSLYAPVALSSLATEIGPLREACDELGVPLRGASVTVPFKEEAAALAGATGEARNTLLFCEDGAVASAERGIPSRRAISPRNSPSLKTATVISSPSFVRTAIRMRPRTMM